MATTNVPQPTFGSNGFIAPSEQDILTGVFADINAAFGGNLNPALETPQGQLASSEAAIIGNSNDTFLFFTNQIDPAFAAGRMQDAIGRIYFITRLPSEPTVVQCTCIGAAGVTVPLGATAVSTDGTVYTCTQAGTFDVTGTMVLTFACNVPGPTVCPAGTLNQIYQAIPGWDSINNLSDGVIGQNTESRQAFEARRAASVAQNSTGSLGAILGAVLGVSGVLDAYVTENVNGTSSSVGGVTLAAKSLYVAVVGGSSADIAAAIWSKKAPGCAYNGNTTVVVQDTNPGYVPPYPSYSVTFQIPTPVPILFAVNVANSAQVPSDAATKIQNAIINAFSGGDGGTRARIGSTIYASRFYAAIAALGAWAQIISLKVSSINSPIASFTGVIAGTTLTVSGVTGVIAIGQTVVDAAGNVLPGTVITAGSGTSWTVSRTQTVSSEAMVAAKPTLDSIFNNINQVPTISANNIAVTLT
jgi:hypothetical protein